LAFKFDTSENPKARNNEVKIFSEQLRNVVYQGERRRVTTEKGIENVFKIQQSSGFINPQRKRYKRTTFSNG